MKNKTLLTLLCILFINIAIVCFTIGLSWGTKEFFLALGIEFLTLAFFDCMILIYYINIYPLK